MRSRSRSRSNSRLGKRPLLLLSGYASGSDSNSESAGSSRQSATDIHSTDGVLQSAEDRPDPFDDEEDTDVAALLRDHVEAGESFRSAAEQLQRDFEEVVTRVFSPQPVSVHTVGSVVQGTCVVGSDLDLCVSFPEPRGAGVASAIESLRRIQRGIMTAGPEECRIVLAEAVYNAAVPVLRVRHSSTGELEADVSIADPVEEVGRGDRAVHTLLSDRPRAREFVLLVKFWARQHGVHKAYSGYPSCFAWVLLSIFYLQRVGVVPPLCGRRRLRKLRCVPPVRELLSGFFAFCSEELVDCRLSMSLERGDFVVSPETARALYVQVPREPGKNAARCLRPECWRQVLQKVQVSKALLQRAGVRAAIDAGSDFSRRPRYESRMADEADSD